MSSPLHKYLPPQCAQLISWLGILGKKYGTWLSICFTVWCLRIRYFALTPTVFLIPPVNAKNLMSLLWRVAEWLRTMLAQLTWGGITWGLEFPGLLTTVWSGWENSLGWYHLLEVPSCDLVFGGGVWITLRDTEGISRIMPGPKMA